jgi:hypothetical protein
MDSNEWEQCVPVLREVTGLELVLQVGVIDYLPPVGPLHNLRALEVRGDACVVGKMLAGCVALQELERVDVQIRVDIHTQGFPPLPEMCARVAESPGDEFPGMDGITLPTVRTVTWGVSEHEFATTLGSLRAVVQQLRGVFTGLRNMSLELPQRLDGCTFQEVVASIVAGDLMGSVERLHLLHERRLAQIERRRAGEGWVTEWAESEVVRHQAV